MGAPSASATSAAATSGGAQSGQHTEGKKGRFTVYTGVENGVPFMEASGPADLKTTMENLLKVLLQVYAGFYRCSSDVLSNRRDAPQPPPSVAVAVAEDTDSWEPKSKDRSIQRRRHADTLNAGPCFPACLPDGTADGESGGGETKSLSRAAAAGPFCVVVLRQQTVTLCRVAASPFLHIFSCISSLVFFY